MSEELLAQIDARAQALGLKRSAYLASLARKDLSERGDFIIREIKKPTEGIHAANLNETTPGLKADTVRKVVDTLKKSSSVRYPRPSRPKTQP